MQHARRTSQGSVESYQSQSRGGAAHALGPAPARRPHPASAATDREQYAPPPHEADSYAAPARVRPSPQPSEYSAAGEYGSYLPPASVVSSQHDDLSETQSQSQYASYQPSPQQQRYARGGDAYDGSAFEPVPESRHHHARQASLESHYTSVSAREGRDAHGHLAPAVPGAPYGAAVPYLAQGRAYASPSASSTAASTPRTNGASAAVAAVARAQRRGAKPKHAHAPLNILDAAEEEEEALSVPGSPASPSSTVAPSRHHPPDAPPPVPPNPALLALRTRVHSKLSSALSSLAASSAAHLSQLDLMQTDLEKAVPAIEDEMARLEAVRSVCGAVRARYAEVVEAAEGRMREYEQRGEGVDVDEIVCGSTVVYTQ